MRTVVSVSMEPEMATRLKSSAAEKGQSFSARVCELLESGEALERLDAGLFTPTGAEYEDFTIKPVEELLHDPAGSVGADQEDAPVDDGGNKADLAAEIGQDTDHAEQVLPSGTVEERVYGCVSAEKTSVKSIAERVGISEVEAGEVLERLIDQDNEPIVLKPIAGEWTCWLAA